MKFKVFEKLSFLNEARKEKIYWNSQFYGATKEKEYKIEHVCKPIKDKYFKTLYDLFIYSQVKIPYEEVELNKKIEIPKEIIKERNKELLSIVPKYAPKKGKILSVEIDYIALERTTTGWIIYLRVVGLWNI
jgi:hypothetical protein